MNGQSSDKFKNYTISEVSTILRYSDRTVRRLCQQGKLKGAFKPKGGRKWIIPETAVDKYSSTSEENELANAEVDAIRESAIDSFLVESQQEHISEIRKLIQELREIVKTPKIDDIVLDVHKRLSLKVEVSDSEKNCLSDFESDLLFKCVKEHLPIESLWNDFHSWQEGIHDYLNNFKQLAEIISQDKKLLNILDEYPNKEEWSIIQPIFKFISDKALGKTLDIQENPYTGDFEPYLTIETEGKAEFIRRTSRTTWDEKVIVKSVQYVDPEICFKYLNSEQAETLTVKFNALNVLERNINKILDEILIKRIYTKAYCKLCPITH